LKAISTVPDFTVSFGPIARTIVYEDPQGKVVYTFDVSQSTDQKQAQSTLHLDRRPLTEALKLVTSASPIESERFATALNRAANYAVSCGYVVEIV
jgi:hypothetical protein